MNSKLIKAFKILYLIIQQISLGFISWIIYPFPNSKYTYMVSFFLFIILTISVMIPSLYINDKLLVQHKVLKVVQVVIPIIVFTMLVIKVGKPIISLY